jgi:hypothetical protein
MARRGRRRRRFVLFAHALTAVVHIVPAMALSALLPVWVAVLLALSLWVLTALRLHALALDRRRPRWLTHLVDEPVFWHWGGCLVGLPLLAAAVPVAVLGGWSPARAALAAYALGLVVSAWSVWGIRRRPRVRRVDVAIAGLPPQLDGYAVAQLSDLHIGSFDPPSRGARWVELCNALQPDLTVVTGDLVTSGVEFYDDTAELLGQLSARDGVLVTMGNHDQWDAERFIAAIRARGPAVLLNEWTCVVRDGATLVVAGLDDRFAQRDDLEQALSGRPVGAPTLLLSHYPDFFERAAERGVELVLSGHTHGGQFGLPFVGERYNIATLAGTWPRGLFRSGSSQLYVNAGLGTTGPPMRLGVPPEIALLVLRRG